MSKTKNFFKDLKLKKFIIDTINNLGYKNPSPIQKICIPYLLIGNDVLGISQTGSGKTAAFVLPFLNKINIKNHNPQLLILTPTRELTIQIKEYFIQFTKYNKYINITALYGGQNYNIQINSIKKGSHIIIGTPGRVLDFLQKKILNTKNINKIVLDEADEMLKIGFINDIKKILFQIPKDRQIALFSATMPNEIKEITYKFMNKPKEVIINNIKKIPSNINQYYYFVNKLDKVEILICFLETEIFCTVIIFVRTKKLTILLSKILEKKGYNNAVLNGDMNQKSREQTLNNLKNKKINILIATDIAARGLNIDHINLIINYSIPIDIESYIHRIGRTGRAGKLGKSLLLIEYKDYKIFKKFLKLLKNNINEIKLPTDKLIFLKRLDNLILNLKKYLNNNNLDKYKIFIQKIKEKENISTEILAIALLKIVQKDNPLIIENDINLINKNKFHKNKQFNKRNILFKSKNINLYSINIGNIKKHQIINLLHNKFKINIKYIRKIEIFKFYSKIEL